VVVLRGRYGILRNPVLRRVITIPVLLLLAALTALVVPVVGVITAPFALRHGGRWRAFRFGAFLAVYLGAEILGLMRIAALWTRGVRGGRSQDGYQKANYELLSRLLGWLYAAAIKFYGLRVLVQEPLGGVRSDTPKVPELPPGPLIVLSRHGGPGDSFLLIHALLAHGHRRPRIVLKDTLVLDPFIDLVLHRIPHCFIDPRPGGHDERTVAEIRQLATGMGPGDALVVFPEGGNFTSDRRDRAIARLRRRGLRESANRAKRLRHVLPPRPAGVFAAIDAAPAADVVFVAHTGLDHMESVAEVWRSVPLTEPVEATWWTVPASRVPLENEARLRWLQDNWAEVDAWIGRHRTDALSANSAEGV
jgi:1-acyl-sn-glycerol-3-phosphate acyltransferase